MKTIMNLTSQTKNEETPVMATNHLVVKDDNIDVKKDDKILPVIEEDDNSQEFSSNICYDNPAFIGININDNLTDNNNITKVNTQSYTTINLQRNNGGDKVPVPNSPHQERQPKARTYSIASVKSFTSALQSDRRYSRRLSIVQRKCDTAGHPDMPDGNPLRRKMSFIKDTSGEEPLMRSSIQILIASLCAGISLNWS